MQAQAARDVIIGRVALAGILAAVIGSGAVSPARAENKPVVRPGKVPSAAAPSASRCANYGEGFVPVVGSDSCVKIGGRLRIDLGGSMATPVYSGPRDGIAPAAHVRVSR